MGLRLRCLSKQTWVPCVSSGPRPLTCEVQAVLRDGGRLPGGAGGGDGGAEGEGALYYIGACLLLCSLAIFYGAVWCRRPWSPPL